MKLDSYRSVDGLPFDTTPAQLRQWRGAPAREARNGVGLTELDYGDTVYRF